MCQCNEDIAVSLSTGAVENATAGGSHEISALGGVPTGNVPGVGQGGTSQAVAVGGTGGAQQRGGSSAGGTSPAAFTGSVAHLARLSELKIDPPGVDGNNEYIELAGDPGAYLAGYWLVVIEGDAESNLGQVDKVIDLSTCGSEPCRFGDNGLLLLIAAVGALTPIEPASSVSVASSLVRGGLENGTAFIGLFSGISAPTSGSDWDLDDDGILELPAGAIEHDSMSWTDGGAGDGLYSATRLGPKPLSAAAWRCGAECDASAWRYGLILGESASLVADVVHLVPSGLLDASLTPGAANSCVPVEPTTGAGGSASAATVAASGGFGGAPTTATFSPSGGAATTTLRTTTSDGAGSGGTRAMTTKTTKSSGAGGASSGGASSGESAAAGADKTGSGDSPIVVAAPTASVHGGASGWWSTDPFGSESNLGGRISDDRDDSSGTSGGSEAGNNTSRQSQPRVPDGCTVDTTAQSRKPSHFLPLLSFLLLCYVRLERRRTRISNRG